MGLKLELGRKIFILIENLFEIMARGKAGLQYWTEGAGLGLYTARKFAEMHGAGSGRKVREKGRVQLSILNCQ